MIGLVDTHCHLQSPVLAEDLDALLRRSAAVGVEMNVICAGGAGDWERCREIAHQQGCAYMLGIHPMETPNMRDGDLALLAERIERSLADPRFVGIGEIGLDGSVPLDDSVQERVFAEQLRLAARFALPISVHLRKSASRLLKYLRRFPPVSGVVHAFNGSDVEREAFLRMGLKLGFGGALTYEGSQRIRRHLTVLKADEWVLETDAPDMLSSFRREKGGVRTEPADLLDTARVAAKLREESLEMIAVSSRRNAIAAFPRLAGLLSSDAG